MDELNKEVLQICFSITIMATIMLTQNLCHADGLQELFDIKFKLSIWFQIHNDYLLFSQIFCSHHFIFTVNPSLLRILVEWLLAGAERSQMGKIL